jgi:hypothetical protein
MTAFRECSGLGRTLDVDLSLDGRLSSSMIVGLDMVFSVCYLGDDRAAIREVSVFVKFLMNNSG